jgi:hypothetical protein
MKNILNINSPDNAWMLDIVIIVRRRRKRDLK